MTVTFRNKFLCSVINHKVCASLFFFQFYTWIKERQKNKRAFHLPQSPSLGAIPFFVQTWMFCVFFSHRTEPIFLLLYFKRHNISWTKGHIYNMIWVRFCLLIVFMEDFSKFLARDICFWLVIGHIYWSSFEGFPWYWNFCLRHLKNV